MPIEHQLVQSLVKPAMMEIEPPFLIFDGGYEGVPITITRATTKLLMGPAGVYYTVPINAQPHEWEIGGAYIGRRYEKATIWRLLHNRDWTDAVFDTVTNITAAKDATGIDGVANSASSLTATAANGVIGQSRTLTSAERTSSIFVQRVTGVGDIDFSDDGGSNWTTLTGLSSSLFTSHEITRTQANPDVRIRIVTSGDKINVDMGGLEQGAIRTSPIEVGATAAARAADVPTTTDLRWMDQSKGTFLAKASHPAGGIAGINNYLFEVSKDTSDVRHNLWLNATIGMKSETRGGAANGDLSIAASTWAANTTHKVIMAYADDDNAAAFDGGTEATDTDVGMPADLNILRIGMNRSSTNNWNGQMSSLPYWPDRRPGIELKAISA